MVSNFQLSTEGKKNTVSYEVVVKSMMLVVVTCHSKYKECVYLQTANVCMCNSICKKMVIYHFFPLQIKLSSVQLARKYMKRVASELDALSGPEKEPNREFLVLQGVRFAFRVHQVCQCCALLKLKSGSWIGKHFPIHVCQ